MIQDIVTNEMPSEVPPLSQPITLEEAELLGLDLKKLLVRSQNELVRGNARDKVEQLERWVESYRRGLSAAYKISHSGVGMLIEARDQLRLALEEQLRLEDEGGNPATKEQAAQVEQLTAAVRRMDRLIPLIEGSFHAVHHPEAA